jgi:hypothetical protein
MFSQTIRENLLYANPKATPEQLTAALRDAGCTAIIDSLPDGLDTKLAGNLHPPTSLHHVLLFLPSLPSSTPPAARLRGHLNRFQVQALLAQASVSAKSSASP